MRIPYAFVHKALKLFIDQIGHSIPVLSSEWVRTVSVKKVNNRATIRNNELCSVYEGNIDGKQ